MYVVVDGGVLCGAQEESRANGSFRLLVALQAAGSLTFQMLKSSLSIFMTSNSVCLSVGHYFDSIPIYNRSASVTETEAGSLTF